MAPESVATVFIVDDDKTICSGISQLVRTVGLNSESFTSAQQFLDYCTPACTGCLVLDVRMPDVGGLALQDKLAAKSVDLPIIFITGHGSIKMGVEAIKKGAVDFIEKPFDDQVLLDQIQIALERDAKNRQAKHRKQLALDRIESLTQREQEIMYLVAHGKLNKSIAYKLEISQKTVEHHRSRAMKKLRVDSVAELVRLLGSAGVL